MLPLLLLSSLLLATATAQLGPPPQQGDNIPPKVAPTRFENFTYSDPFTAPTTSSCSHSRAFPALEYQLHDLSSDASSGQPGLLRAYRAGLKSLFSDRPYPGGWDGMDAHGYEREVVGMRWEDVPRLVQGWIAEQEDEGKLFGVFDKEGKPVVDEEEGGEMVMFAPGAVYETLPLWVAEGSGCEGMCLFFFFWLLKTRIFMLTRNTTHPQIQCRISASTARSWLTVAWWVG